MAKFNVRLAAMDSGKSDTLIKTHYNYHHRKNLETLAIKPSLDSKGDNRIVSRAGPELETDFLITPDMDVRARIALEQHKTLERHQSEQHIARRAVGLQVILVDEAQFLTERQVGELYLTALVDDISVICYGLRSDFLTTMFPATKRMLELADTTEIMTTMCDCGSQARFNARLIDGEVTFEGGQIAIDGQGEVTYESMCGSCYIAAGGEATILGDA